MSVRSPGGGSGRTARVAAVLLALALPATAAAQEAPPEGAPVARADTASPSDPAADAAAQAGERAGEAAAQAAADEGSFLGIAKWAALAVSGGAALYGFSLNSQADRIFDDITAICDEDPERCMERNPDGSFLDDALERRYGDVVSRDNQARAALIVSQATLAASVLFFIMDLSNKRPPDIPFDPVDVDVEPGRRGSVALKASFSLPF